MNSKYYNLSSSFLISILILFSPSKNFITNSTLALGAILTTMTTLLYILNNKHELIRIENLYVVHSTFLIGVLMEVVGMFSGQFLAVFHISTIPFSYYMLLSLLISVQLFIGTRLLWDITSNKPN